MTLEAQQQFRKNLARLLAATAPAWGLAEARQAAVAPRTAPAGRMPASAPARTHELLSCDPVA